MSSLLLFTDYVAQRTKLAFAQLPFAYGFHDVASAFHNGNVPEETLSKSQPVNGFHVKESTDQSMDCIENREPVSECYTANHQHQRREDEVHDSMATVDRDRFLGEITHNRQEPFSCLKFKEQPVKCQNYFMSHYI